MKHNKPFIMSHHCWNTSVHWDKVSACLFMHLSHLSHAWSSICIYSHIFTNQSLWSYSSFLYGKDFSPDAMCFVRRLFIVWFFFSNSLIPELPIQIYGCDIFRLSDKCFVSRRRGGFNKGTGNFEPPTHLISTRYLIHNSFITGCFQIHFCRKLLCHFHQ